MLNYSFFQRLPLSVFSLLGTNIRIFKIQQFCVMIKKAAYLVLQHLQIKRGILIHSAYN